MSLIDLGHYLGDQGELEKRLVLVLLRKSILIDLGHPYPANDCKCKWKRKRGNNGDWYKSEPDKNKVFRWENLVILFV